MDAAAVGTRLCALCREGKNLDAIEELYADDVVSVEAAEGGGMPRTMEGKATVRGKTEWWSGAHEVHDQEIVGPLPHGKDRFAVVFEIDVTNIESGQRFDMTEVAVYTVRDGKVAREEFYYTA